MADELDIVFRRLNLPPVNFDPRGDTIDGLLPAIKAAIGDINKRFGEIESVQRQNLARHEELYREIFRRLRLVEDAAFGNLLNIAWYGAAHQDIAAMRDDMDALEAKGYNNPRVWATWEWSSGGVNPNVDSPIDFSGNIVTVPMDRLRNFIGEAATRGWTVEVVLSHNKLGSQTNHNRAVGSLASGIGDLDNWFLDLANEHEGISYSLLAPYNNAREFFPDIQLTASTSGPVGFQADLYNQDLEEGLAWDLLTPHLPRTSDWHTATQQRVEGFIDALTGSAAALGTRVHLNEENGVGGTGGPPPSNANEWTVAGEGARLGGAFGTGFFTLAGFSFKSNPSLIDQLAGIEVAGIDNLATGWLGA